MEFTIAQEVNAVRSESDTYYNYEAFVSGERKVLFVTGLSGGGKTTLARDIASKYGAIAFPLDLFYHMNNMEIFNDEYAFDKAKKLFMQFANSAGRNYMIRNDDGEMVVKPQIVNSMTAVDLCYDFCKWILEKESSLKTPVVVEGVQLHLYIKLHSLTFNNPLVIKQTPLLTAFIRATRRDYTRGVLSVIFRQLFNGQLASRVDWYNEMKVMVNKLQTSYEAHDGIGMEGFFSFF